MAPRVLHDPVIEMQVFIDHPVDVETVLDGSPYRFSFEAGYRPNRFQCVISRVHQIATLAVSD